MLMAAGLGFCDCCTPFDSDSGSSQVETVQGSLDDMLVLSERVIREDFNLLRDLAENEMFLTF